MDIKYVRICYATLNYTVNLLVHHAQSDLWMFIELVKVQTAFSQPYVQLARSPYSFMMMKTYFINEPYFIMSLTE